MIALAPGSGSYSRPTREHSQSEGPTPNSTGLIRETDLTHKLLRFVLDQDPKIQRVSALLPGEELTDQVQEDPGSIPMRDQKCFTIS